MLLPLLAVASLSTAVLSDADRKALLVRVALGDFERLFEELGMSQYLKLVAVLPDGELKHQANIKVRDYFDIKIFSGPGHKHRARMFRGLLQKHHGAHADVRSTSGEVRRKKGDTNLLWRDYTIYDHGTHETHVDLGDYPWVEVDNHGLVIDGTPFCGEILEFLGRHIKG